ncbi:restriction endonuclease subunit S [Nguyenibacter vanlangensis]|nr:restriction endonuclease subunit S [Nguyenibacter vanlangensis]
MLPKGWVETDLGSLMLDYEVIDPRLTPERKFSYVEIGSIDNKIQKIVSPKFLLGKDAPSRARRVIKEGDIVFSTVRPYLKNISLVPKELDNQLTSTGMCVIRTHELVDTRYIFLLICSREFLEEVSLKQDGTLYPAVSDRDVTDAKVPLPPLAEQRRIVAKLDSLTARIARARVELERVQVLRKHLKHKATQEIFSTNSKWPTARLQDLVSDGPSNGWSPSTDNTAQGTLSLKLTATTSGYIRLDNNAIKRIHETVPHDSKFWLKNGDILIQRANALEHLGISAIFYGPEKKYIYPDLMIRVRVEDENLSRLIWYFLNSPNTRQYFRENATGTAGNMPKINGKLVKQLLIPVPPSDVRAHVVKSFDALFAHADRLKSESQHALTLLDRLESSLFAKAFRGELVPQDPNDEPASILLDRIRAECAAAPKPKRGRKA